MTTSVCIVCQSIVPEDSSLYGLLLRCPQCGFVFADACLSEDEHRALYQKDYFFGHEYADYLRSKDALQRNFRRRFETLTRFSPGGRLYEIGAAYGFSLDLARTRWEVQGIDVAEHACVYARQELGLDVACGDFLKVSLAHDSYDVFCMWDTIEHLQEPDRYLDKISRHLSNGGILALTTGDIGSWSARLQGRHWRLIHPPTHLHYFSAETIERILARFGFEVVQLSHPGFYRTLDGMAHWALTRFGRWGEDVYNRVRQAGWMQKGAYINLYDIMFVVAQKN